MTSTQHDFFSAALADYIVLESLSLLPSITEGAGNATDANLQQALTHYLKNGMISSKTPAGHHFSTMVNSLSLNSPEVTSSEEAFESLPELFSQEEDVAQDVTNIAYNLANVIQTSFEGLAALSEKADTIVKRVDHAGAAGHIAGPDSIKRNIETIDLGVAADSNIIQDASVVASDFFGDSLKEAIFDAAPTVFASRGRSLPYKSLDTGVTTSLHSALDHCDLECPRENIHRLLMSAPLKATLFPRLAFTDKDEFISGSLFTRALWNTLENIIAKEGDENVESIFIDQAKELRKITAVAVMYFSALLNKVYSDMLVFNYNDSDIFVSPIGYERAQNDSTEADDIIKDFVSLKAFKKISVPAHGWSIREVLDSKERTTLERNKALQESLKNSDVNRHNAERAAIERELRAAVKDNKIELLSDRARTAYHEALRNNDQLSNHVMDFLVHAADHPVLSTYHKTAKEAVRSNEELSQTKAQGTFDAVGRVFLGALIR